MKTLIALTSLLACVATYAQGLTRDIQIGAVTLAVQDGRIVGISEPPAPPAVTPTPPGPMPVPARAVRAPKGVKPRPVPAPVTRAPAAAVAEPVPLANPYTIELADGTRITVAAPAPFTEAELRRTLRQAAVNVR